MKTRQLILSLIFLLLAALPAGAQPTTSDFQQAVAEYQQSHSVSAAEKVIALAAQMDPPPAIPAEARKHMSRGAAAAEGAKTVDGFKDAAAEFQLALNAAPWLADGYRNIAIVQDKAGLYEEAFVNLKLYLLTKPSARDVEWAEDRQSKIEYRQEKVAAKPVATKELFEAFGITEKPGPVELRRGCVSVDAVRAAIEKGADLNAKECGFTVLTAGVCCGQANIVRILIENGADVRNEHDLILLAVCYARDAADIVKLLIDKGADVNARRADDRETALMWAAQIADLDLVRLLLKNGADVHAKDCHGKTALRRLVEDGDAGGGFWDANRMAQFEHDKPEVIRLLKRAGAADE